MIEKVTVNCILLISLKFYKSNSFKLFRWAPMTPSSHWLPPIKGNETIILSTKDMDVPMPKKRHGCPTPALMPRREEKADTTT
jgi:hypothetical protein